MASWQQQFPRGFSNASLNATCDLPYGSPHAPTYQTCQNGPVAHRQRQRRFFSDLRRNYCRRPTASPTRRGRTAWPATAYIDYAWRIQPGCLPVNSNQISFRLGFQCLFGSRAPGSGSFSNSALKALCWLRDQSSSIRSDCLLRRVLRGRRRSHGNIPARKTSARRADRTGRGVQCHVLGNPSPTNGREP